MSLFLVVLALLVPGDTSIVVRKCCNLSSQFTNANCVENAPISSKFFEILKSDNESLTVTYGVPNCTHPNRTTIMAGEIIDPNRTRLEMITTADTETCLDVVDGKLIKFTCMRLSRGESSVQAIVPTTKTTCIHLYIYFRLTLMVLSALSLLRLAQKFMKMPPTIHNRGVLSSSTTLAGGYIFLIAITFMRHQDSKIPFVCPMTGTLLQFLVLAHFFWVNVICYDLWRTFGNKLFVEPRTSNRFRMYSWYVWGCTLFIVIVTISAEFFPFVPSEFKPMFDGITCFFGSRVATIIYFQSFMVLIIFSNFIMFILILRNLKRHARNIKRLNRDKLRFTLYVRLSLFMGVSWFIFLIPFTIPIMRELPWTSQIMGDLHGIHIFFTFIGSSSNLSGRPTSVKIDVESTSTSLKSKMATTSHPEG